MKILSAHQPCYMPWLGYFNKIVNADIFVILDDVQYERGSYINRVKIKTQQGAKWMTVPVHASIESKIWETLIVDNNWYEKHIKTIRQNYYKAKYYKENEWIIECLSGRIYIGVLKATINSLCAFLIMNICEKIGYYQFKNVPYTKIYHLANLQHDKHKQELIIELCKYFKADAFLFGMHGRDYCDIELFKQNSIEPIFQDFKCIEYPQLWGDFIPGLSILDALFNVGIDKTKELIHEGFRI